MSHDDQYREWDAAYVLGAVSTNERREYEIHLDGCRSCRRAVSELAPIPGLLSAVPAPLGAGKAAPTVEASPAADAPTPLRTLAERARRARRRSRMLLAAAAVGVLFIGGAAGAAVMGLVGKPASVVAAVEPLRLGPIDDSGVDADVTLTDTAWGTRLDWTCSYPEGIEPGHDYELVVVDAAGIRRVVATWTGDGKPRSEGLTAATSTPRDDIERIELTAAPSGTVLAATSN